MKLYLDPSYICNGLAKAFVANDQQSSWWWLSTNQNDLQNVIL